MTAEMKTICINCDRLIDFSLEDGKLQNCPQCGNGLLLDDDYLLGQKNDLWREIEFLHSKLSGTKIYEASVLFFAFVYCIVTTLMIYCGVLAISEPSYPGSPQEHTYAQHRFDRNLRNSIEQGTTVQDTEKLYWQSEAAMKEKERNEKNRLSFEEREKRWAEYETAREAYRKKKPVYLVIASVFALPFFFVSLIVCYKKITLNFSKGAEYRKAESELKELRAKWKSM